MDTMARIKERLLKGEIPFASKSKKSGAKPKRKRLTIKQQKKAERREWFKHRYDIKPNKNNEVIEYTPAAPEVASYAKRPLTL